MRTRGFTLMELLVVIAIIGLLSSVVIASMSLSRKKGRDARRLSDLKQLEAALALYNNDFAKFPIPTAANTAYSVVVSTDGLLARGLTSAFVPAVPDDPLGGSQHYYWISDATGSAYCIGARMEIMTPIASCSSATWKTTLNTATAGTYSVGP